MAITSSHIFEDHLLRAGNLAPLARTVNEEIWPSLLLVTCLLILVLVKIRSFPKVVRIVQSTFSKQILQQLEREEINAFRFYAVGLNILFIFNIAFLLYKINQHFQVVFEERGHLSQFLFFTGITLGVILAKNLLNLLLGICTGERRAIADYLVNSSLINQTFGLFLFPCIILMEFSPFNPLIFIWTGVTIVIAGIFIKWYRGLLMGLVEQRIGLLQIFSYFCGLEILPVFVLVKYIIETF